MELIIKIIGWFFFSYAVLFIIWMGISLATGTLWPFFKGKFFQK
ncbi:MAG: hypothetical protein PHX80_04375 [Candidatus Nanoarchaeia archaeon]|nr:hypothetical protein [Candidatus Nanoarchaeia archaeon]